MHVCMVYVKHILYIYILFFIHSLKSYTFFPLQDRIFVVVALWLRKKMPVYI